VHVPILQWNLDQLYLGKVSDVDFPTLNTVYMCQSYAVRPMTTVHCTLSPVDLAIRSVDRDIRAQ
jgi:hypothetical protein